MRDQRRITVDIEHTDPATGTGHTDDLHKGTLNTRNVRQGCYREDSVERLIGKRKASAVSFLEMNEPA